MIARSDGSLIVQTDGMVLLDTRTPGSDEAREALSGFAELVKSPDPLHTWRVTSLSLWNAAATGLAADAILAMLDHHARLPVPEAVATRIRSVMDRAGRARILREGDDLVLEADPGAADEIFSLREILSLAIRGAAPEAGDEGRVRLRIEPSARGPVKQALARAGFPAEDLAGYAAANRLPVALRSVTASGRPFALRPYQEAAAQAFFAGGTDRGGHGVVVLPCGAGKTLTGIRIMELHGLTTLILTTNRTAVRQWIDELLDRTDLDPGTVGEYTGERKEIRPVTVSTYQILTHRQSRTAPMPHMDLLARGGFGLVIWDEVHLLPAPVFRATAELQARRRLGLTATLVREDGREEDVFALIGPRRFEAPWRRLEREGYIAAARCVEVRVPLPLEARAAWEAATPRERHRMAAENAGKIDVLRYLLGRHRGESVLVIGQYLRQLEAIRGAIGAPMITSATPEEERRRLYGAFRRREILVLIVSKVANFAVDLPDASVALQVSGTFGSRQEEAQRLGRILRRKSDGRPASFYTLVSEGTSEIAFAARRQRFLLEQGYDWIVERARPAPEEAPT